MINSSHLIIIVIIIKIIINISNYTVSKPEYKKIAIKCD